MLVGLEPGTEEYRKFIYDFATCTADTSKFGLPSPGWCDGVPEAQWAALMGDDEGRRIPIHSALAPVRAMIDAKLNDGCSVEIDVLGYASVKRFPTDEGEHARLNWYLAEGRRASAIAALQLPYGKLQMASGEGTLTVVDGTDLAPEGHAEGWHYRFADHSAMRASLQAWYDEPNLPQDQANPLAEAFARSVVVAIRNSDLSDCRKEPIEGREG